MDSKNKEIINFEFDPELLNQFFEKLSLGSDIPDLTDSLAVLDIEPKYSEISENNKVVGTDASISCESLEIEINLNNTIDSNLKTFIKTENEENFNNFKDSEHVSLSEIKVPSELLEEKEDNLNCSFIKSEPCTSSSDDDDSEPLVSRGGPDRTEKRSHRKKDPNPYDRPSSAEFDSQKLLHGSSCIIIENNYNHLQVQANFLSTNYEELTADPLLSPRCLNVCSPESGYDTSQSSVDSPSPPVEGSFVHHLVEEDYETDERRAVKEIFNSLLEEEKLFFKKNNRLQVSDANDNIVHQVYDTFNPLQNSMRYVGSINLENEVSLNSISFDNDYSDFSNDLNDIFKDFADLPTQVSVETSSRQKPDCSLNQNSKPLIKPTSQEENCRRKISYTIGNNAKKALKTSESFDSDKYRDEEKNLLGKIKYQQRNNEAVKIIDVEEREPFKSLRQTNLHSAVIESNVEKVVCLIEGSKRFDLDLFEINTKDNNQKTALDYAKQPLLINYLKENNAVQTIDCLKRKV